MIALAIRLPPGFPNDAEEGSSDDMSDAEHPIPGKIITPRKAHRITAFMDMILSETIE
jgi:hypothetical protein